jgi:hypothetical protein
MNPQTITSFFAAIGLLSVVLHTYWFLKHLRMVRNHKADVIRSATMGQLVRARCKDLGLNERELFGSDKNPIKVLGIPVFHKDGTVSWREYDESQDTHSQ